MTLGLFGVPASQKEPCPVRGCKEHRPFGYRWCVEHTARREKLERAAEKRRSFEASLRQPKRRAPIAPGDDSMTTHPLPPVETHMDVLDIDTIADDFFAQTLRPGSEVGRRT